MTSTEALQLRAMQMFNRSVELQTGGIQWTRGELLGEGSYGRVSTAHAQALPTLPFPPA